MKDLIQKGLHVLTQFIRTISVYIDGYEETTLVN